ncbi:PAQR family membrane homeostasis protein TrhA [Olsenella profusa]|uniref:Hemolysin III family protein n=1 Tax=Olsenella profusa TaxID=138595 RepID=A0ABS2F2R6_9ACTN|nr:hemolysin III family protein [Olsenella profusa]MBM6775105.1 hemolysin III family protein [Olsenella profusa]
MASATDPTTTVPDAAGPAGAPAGEKPLRKRLYSLGEEIANSVSHGVGVLLAIAALVLLIVTAVSHGGGVRLAAALIMGISLIIEYLFSTLYHALAPEKAKAVFRVLDHCGIYLLIAGSYAPFSLVTLADRGGIPLCAAVWAVAVAGIVAECLLRERQPAWLTAIVYVIMGWLVIFRVGDLWELLAPPAFWLLLAGGLSYTVGAVLYAIKKVPYLHFVFHLFTLAGSVCITLSALLFVV